MQSSPLSPASAGLMRRQTGGFDLTPEQLAQIDFDNKTDLRPLVLAVSGVVIALLMTIVPLRLVVRKRWTGQLFLDDALMILAALFTVVLCALSIAGKRLPLSLPTLEMRYSDPGQQLDSA